MRLRAAVVRADRWVVEPGVHLPRGLDREVVAALAAFLRELLNLEGVGVRHGLPAGADDSVCLKSAGEGAPLIRAGHRVRARA